MSIKKRVKNEKSRIEETNFTNKRGHTEKILTGLTGLEERFGGRRLKKQIIHRRNAKFKEKEKNIVGLQTKTRIDTNFTNQKNTASEFTDKKRQKNNFKPQD